MLKFDIFLPCQPFSFEPPSYDRSGFGVVGPLLAVFVFLFFLTGGASWFPRGGSVANQAISVPQAAPGSKLPR